jgi:hypothetical protein
MNGFGPETCIGLGDRKYIAIKVGAGVSVQGGLPVWVLLMRGSYYPGSPYPVIFPLGLSNSENV